MQPMNVPTVISSICYKKRRHLNLRRVICALLNTISQCVSLTAGVCVLLGSALVHDTVCPCVLEKCGTFGKR